jgi:peptidoglycan hydrolase-like protein with peptidoglycan-binding domain
MGKSRASLLSIVFQLFLITAIFADEEVRSVQKELRKRHLFHGDSTGETSPALTAAIRRYQQIKGFVRTGVVDSETAGSLGIMGHPVPATTPFVVDNTGDLRGANGEVLRESLPARWASEELAAQFKYAAADSDPRPMAPAKAESGNTLRNKVAAKRRPAGRIYPVRARKETNPFLQAFSSIGHARKLLFRDVDAKKKRKTGKRL